MRLILAICGCLVLWDSAFAAATYCADSSRLEFLANDVIVETDSDGQRVVWADSGSLGTGVVGRLFANLAGEKMGVNYPEVDAEDALVIVRNGKDTTYRPCTTPAALSPDKTALWVTVTRPMIACRGVLDTGALRKSLIELYPRWLKDKSATAEGCAALDVGDVLLVDNEQTEADRQIVLKLWEPVCPKGCSPATTPVYAPPRREVGAYLRPTGVPPEWQRASSDEAVVQRLLAPADLFAMVAMVEKACPKHIAVNVTAVRLEAAGWRDTTRKLLGASADNRMQGALEEVTGEIEAIGAAKWCSDFKRRYGADNPIFQ